jgi:hypothetical protein
MLHSIMQQLFIYLIYYSICRNKNYQPNLSIHIYKVTLVPPSSIEYVKMSINIKGLSENFSVVLLIYLKY